VFGITKDVCSVDDIVANDVVDGVDDGVTKAVGIIDCMGDFEPENLSFRDLVLGDIETGIVGAEFDDDPIFDDNAGDGGSDDAADDGADDGVDDGVTMGVDDVSHSLSKLAHSFSSTGLTFLGFVADLRFSLVLCLLH